MEQFNNAQKTANRLSYEKKLQTPNYEWMQIKHTKKMFIASLVIQARDLDKMYEKVWGRKPWGN